MSVGAEKEKELKRIKELEAKYCLEKEEHRKLFSAVSEGKIDEVYKVAQELKDAGIGAIEVGTILTDAMEMVGTRYRTRIVALPSLLLSTMCFKKVLPIHALKVKESAGVVVMGVVHNDIHDIGKNLVVGMLQVYGYEVHDLGIDVPLEKFIEKAKEVNAHIIGITTLMSTTMPEVQKVVELCKEAGIRDKVKIMVGGAPVSTAFAKKIGADGYAPDAMLAVDLAGKLVKGEQAYLSDGPA